MAQTPRLAVMTIAGLLGLLTAASEARAASLSVNPTRIELSRRATSALLTVKNEGSGAIRVQLTAHGWAQLADGQMDLTPTTDIVFFPSLVTLEPGQSRTIRIGTTAAPGVAERSYRIFVEELPFPVEDSEGGTGVRMYTRLGIPIFIQPDRPKPQPKLSALVVENAVLQFRLENAGTQHFVPTSVIVKGLASSGEVAVERELSAWYVLAGGTREFEVAFDPPACTRVRSVVVEAVVDGAVLKEQLATPQGTCRP